MGEILFCNQPIAALPYYIEGIGWNVYSIEELCYYIEQNTYLLEANFMTDELCTWIGKELKNEKLAAKLKDIKTMNGRLSDFVQAILVDSGYCPREIAKAVIMLIHDMEEKSDFECNKVRADRLMECQKYLSSIYEYKSLLESNDVGAQPKRLIGNIWHNLGTAYAGLFLFQEAANCYEKAYELNGNEESLKEGLCACLCLKDERRFLDMAERNGKGRDAREALRQELESHVSKETPASGNILSWKEEYRRICRI